jgi:hypothetical protein
MAESLKVPVIGRVPRMAAIAGGGLLLGIIGYAWYRAGREPRAPEDTTFPGVGEQPTDLAPSDVSGVSTGGGTSDTGLEFITTNAQWGTKAVAALVEQGFDAVQVSIAIGKYLANQTVTQTEATWIQAAIALVGKPPVGEHSIRLAPVSPTPITKKYKYTVETHQFSTRTNARAAVQRFSDASVANPTRIEVALRATTSDPRNARYFPYYASQKNSGHWPPQAKIYLHVVKENKAAIAA